MSMAQGIHDGIIEILLTMGAYKSNTCICPPTTFSFYIIISFFYIDTIGISLYNLMRMIFCELCLIWHERNYKEIIDGALPHLLF